MKKKINISSEVVTKDFLELKLDALEQKIDEKAKKYRDDVLNKLDEAMGEFGAIREENTIGAYQTSELRKEVDDHEKRIKHIEKIQSVT